MGYREFSSDTAMRDNALNREQVTRSELLEALRREGHSSLTNVRFAVLETDGTITIVSRAGESSS